MVEKFLDPFFKNKSSKTTQKEHCFLLCLLIRLQLMIILFKDASIGKFWANTNVKDDIF